MTPEERQEIFDDAEAMAYIMRVNYDAYEAQGFSHEEIMFFCGKHIEVLNMIVDTEEAKAATQDILSRLKSAGLQ